MVKVNLVVITEDDCFVETDGIGDDDERMG